MATSGPKLALYKTKAMKLEARSEELNREMELRSKPFPFMQLPQEIRCNVYRFASIMQVGGSREVLRTSDLDHVLTSEMSLT